MGVFRRRPNYVQRRRAIGTLTDRVAAFPAAREPVRWELFQDAPWERRPRASFPLTVSGAAPSATSLPHSRHVAWERFQDEPWSVARRAVPFTDRIDAQPIPRRPVDWTAFQDEPWIAARRAFAFTDRVDSQPVPRRRVPWEWFPERPWIIVPRVAFPFTDRVDSQPLARPRVPWERFPARPFIIRPTHPPFWLSKRQAVPSFPLRHPRIRWEYFEVIEWRMRNFNRFADITIGGPSGVFPTPVPTPDNVRIRPFRHGLAAPRGTLRR